MKERQAEKRRPASPASDGDRKDGTPRSLRDEKGESSLIRRNPKASRGIVPRYYSRSFATKKGAQAERGKKSQVMGKKRIAGLIAVHFLSLTPSFSLDLVAPLAKKSSKPEEGNKETLPKIPNLKSFPGI